MKAIEEELEELHNQRSPPTEEKLNDYIARTIASIDGFAWSLPDTQRRYLIGRCDNLRSLLKKLRSIKEQKKEQE